jgi:hypothetical protein
MLKVEYLHRRSRGPCREGHIHGPSTSKETRKILLFWIKALEPKYQGDENLINDL